MSSWLIDLLILLGALCIVCIAAWFILSQVTIPEPFRKILFIVLVVVAAVIAVAVLLSMRGGGRIGLRSGAERPVIGAVVPPPSVQIIRPEFSDASR